MVAKISTRKVKTSKSGAIMSKTHASKRGTKMNTTEARIS